MVWHDGPDFTRLSRLAAAQPAEVAGMLAAGLEAQDPLAAQSIVALAEEGMTPEGAETLLRAAAVDATEAFLVRVAQALHIVTGDESWAGPVASVLASDAFWGVRIDAAAALGQFAPTPALVEALGRGVVDDEYLVRYHSANTLLHYAGRAKKDISEYPALFDKITSDGAATAGEAAATLTAEALKRIS
ncbi:hypothetical protein [Actinophytocola oryzae]|uniref:HEAT repeat protein n=1 Tax=Actinophytocola oryzae TaxID=502181 RepID=A0A4R7VZA3_9PSEU|nr:hypothetical protein [Actinophytocola oryzae]TDV54889.1 hypothetical protein CLV71_103130 [Actinophytocola oryzae]